MNKGHYAEETGGCRRTSDGDFNQKFVQNIKEVAGSDKASCEDACNEYDTCEAYDVSSTGCWLFHTDPLSAYNGGLPNLTESTCFIWTDSEGGDAETEEDRAAVARAKAEAEEDATVAALAIAALVKAQLKESFDTA